MCIVLVTRRVTRLRYASLYCLQSVLSCKVGEVKLWYLSPCGVDVEV